MPKNSVQVFKIDRKTRFEKLFGTVREGSSFLFEHQGQKVAITVKDSTTNQASLVQVLYPPAP